MELTSLALEEFLSLRQMIITEIKDKNRTQISTLHTHLQVQVLFAHSGTRNNQGFGINKKNIDSKFIELIKIKSENIAIYLCSHGQPIL